MGTARAEDPLGKVVFFTKLAEAVPMESGVFYRSDCLALNLNQENVILQKSVTSEFPSTPTLKAKNYTKRTNL